MAVKNYPVRITVRATEEEGAAIERRAERAGKSKSRYLAEVGAEEGTEPMSEEQREELARLRYELNRIGNNVNQLTRQVRSGKGFAAETLGEMKAAVERTTDEILSQL